jgi:aspartate aminotransferase-like enzyme
MTVNFLTGPVEVSRQTRAAFNAAPVSHRDPSFLDTMIRTRASLISLANAKQAALMVGTGTLANDAVAAQIANLPGTGLILSNGEFGERLIDHARRWRLAFTAILRPWGSSFDWNDARRIAKRCRPAWVWAVLSETSTGVLSPMAELLALSEDVGADLCLDAVSAIGLMPVNLRRVRFATAVSGKGLASYPGLAAVFHDERLAPAGRVPRYLDLGLYESHGSVPFTHSSNLLSALDCALATTRWPDKFDRVRKTSRVLRAGLRDVGLPPLAADEHAAPGIITVPMPEGICARTVAQELEVAEVLVAHQSRYLQQRNWLQICLMGEFPEPAPHQLIQAIAAISTRLDRPARMWRKTPAAALT